MKKLARIFVGKEFHFIAVERKKDFPRKADDLWSSKILLRVLLFIWYFALGSFRDFEKAAFSLWIRLDIVDMIYDKFERD